MKTNTVSAPPYISDLTKLSELPSILLISSEDDFLLSLAANLLKTQFAKFDWKRYHIEDVTPDDILSQLNSSSIFGINKPTALFLNVLKTTAWRKDQWKKIEAWALYAHRSVNKLIILWQGIPDKRGSRLPNTFLHLLKKRGTWIHWRNMNRRDKLSLLKWYTEVQLKKSAPPQLLDKLLTATGENLFIACNELRKFTITYPSAKAITEDRLLKILGWHASYNVFEWIEALANRVPSRIVSIALFLSKLSGREPHLFFQVAKMTYQLFMYADMISGSSSSYLNITPWWFRNAKLTSRNYTGEEIEEALNWIYQAYLKSLGIYTSSYSPGEALYEMGVYLAYIGKSRNHAYVGK